MWHRCWGVNHSVYWLTLRIPSLDFSELLKNQYLEKGDRAKVTCGGVS